MFGSKLFKLQRANGCCRGVLLRKTDDFTKTNLHELSILSIMFDTHTATSETMHLPPSHLVTLGQTKEASSEEETHLVTSKEQWH